MLLKTECSQNCAQWRERCYYSFDEDENDDSETEIKRNRQHVKPNFLVSKPMRTDCLLSMSCCHALTVQKYRSRRILKSKAQPLLLVLWGLLATDEVAGLAPRRAEAAIVFPNRLVSLRRLASSNRVFVDIPPRDDVSPYIPLQHSNKTAWTRVQELLPLTADAASSTLRGRGVCILRQPHLRFQDELRRRCRELKRCNHRVEAKLMNSQIASLSRLKSHAQRRAAAAIDLELAYVLPQSDFVFAETGSVTCSCVLSGDNIRRLIKHKAQSAGFVLRAGFGAWSAAAVLNYRTDAMLYHNMTARLRAAPPFACFRPRPVPPH
jgi:hypothetical protein